MKINVDGAFFAGATSFGVGLAMRGRTGQLMGYRQKLFTGMPAVKEGEAVAVLEGIKWALEVDYPQVIIETDNQGVQ